MVYGSRDPLVFKRSKRFSGVPCDNNTIIGGLAFFGDKGVSFVTQRLVGLTSAYKSSELASCQTFDSFPSFTVLMETFFLSSPPTFSLKSSLFSP